MLAAREKVFITCHGQWFRQIHDHSVHNHVRTQKIDANLAVMFQSQQHLKEPVDSLVAPRNARRKGVIKLTCIILSPDSPSQNRQIGIFNPKAVAPHAN